MISVPKYIESNGPHLSWNRKILTKIFNSLCSEKFVWPISINVLDEYWYATGFYRSNLITLVTDFTIRKENEIQTSMNLYVYHKYSANEMALDICKYERPGDQFFMLGQDETKKFILVFSLSKQGEKALEEYSSLIDKCWSELVV